MVKLPIELLSRDNRLTFRWRQRVGTPIGPRIVDHEGTLAPTLEGALAELIGIAQQQASDIESLRHDNEVLQAQLTAAQTVIPPVTPSVVPEEVTPTSPRVVPARKGK